MHKKDLSRSPERRRTDVALALQGGGAAGAFTWGVLDSVLDRGVQIEAISGASAGAVNAVLVADGLIDGGPDRAREKLAGFWRKASDLMPPGSTSATLAALQALDGVALRPSPSLLNPFGFDPLRDLLRDTIDFARLRRESPVGLFISATRVRDGVARIFRTDEVTLEVLMASARLPQLHNAVEIESEAYWDGGYSANPPVIELVRATTAPNILVVELSSPSSTAAPTTGRDIERRLRDFALGASLQRELEMLSELQAICDAEPGAQSPFARHLRALRVDRISAQAVLGHAPPANALDLN
jgi:NTE family protein